EFSGDRHEVAFPPIATCATLRVDRLAVTMKVIERLLLIGAIDIGGDDPADRSCLQSDSGTGGAGKHLEALLERVPRVLPIVAERCLAVAVGEDAGIWCGAGRVLEVRQVCLQISCFGGADHCWPPAISRSK